MTDCQYCIARACTLKMVLIFNIQRTSVGSTDYRNNVRWQQMTIYYQYMIKHAPYYSNNKEYRNHERRSYTMNVNKYRTDVTSSHRFQMVTFGRQKKFVWPVWIDSTIKFKIKFNENCTPQKCLSPDVDQRCVFSGLYAYRNKKR